MKFLMISNNPEIAAFAAENGVDRIFVDLEIDGKVERQGHLTTWISPHKKRDVRIIREAIGDKHLLTRINPISEHSKTEIDAVIDNGTDSIMLPMFKSVDEVKKFVDLVDGRVATIPLIETASALAAIDSISDLEISELFFGLNDLHLDLGLNFLFEPIAQRLLDDACKILISKNLPFGIGGLARVGEGMIPAEKLLCEHARLGSTGAILSRTFHRMAESVPEIQQNMDFAAEVQLLRDKFKMAQSLNKAQLDASLHDIQISVSEILRKSNAS